MKNKSKTTSPTKIRKGILTNWELSPQFNYQQQQQIFHLIRFWITSLNEIPLNYLIQKYLRFIWKIQKNHFYLKYRYLKKNILNQKKRKLLLMKWKKKKLKKNLSLASSKFWRPKHVLGCQIGSYQLKWFNTGLHINVPVFFFPTRNRLNLKRSTKVKFSANCYLKKSKIQTLKLYFMKLLLERKLQKLFKFPVFFNFRHLMFTNKAELRLQTNQTVVFNDCFFFHKDKLFRRTVHVFAFGLYYAQSKLIAQQIATRITRSRKHMRTIKQLKQTINYLRMLSPETCGLQIDIYGKIGAKTRTKFFRITSGKLPKVQTLGNKIHYTYQECYSYTGVFGIHVWLCASI